MEKRKYEQTTSDVIAEGRAKIWTHEYIKDKTVKQEAFYNKVQVFNRDLTLLLVGTHALDVLAARKEKFRKLKYYDAFTASGYIALHLA
jgi:tRNA G26 N,N-dimethylase Trm1